MIINATDNNIIIESKTITGNIIINQTLDNCKVEIEECIFKDFQRTNEHIIFSAKQGINHVDILELSKCVYNNKVFIRGLKRRNDMVFISVEPETKSKIYRYSLIIASLNGEELILEYTDPNIFHSKW